MFSRFATSVVTAALVVTAVATTGCAGSVGEDSAPSDEENGATVETATVSEAEALDLSSLLDTAQELGTKAGPVFDVAHAIYSMYQDVPGKLDAMNAKLDGIAGDTAAMKKQLAAIDAKMDDQFKADFLAPMGAAENYVAIDMKNLMGSLQTSTAADEGTWLTTTNALNNQIEAADTASEKVLDYFAPTDAVASKWTATQWYRIYGYYLRASLVKIALRDAQATLASAYYDRNPTPEYAARKQTAIANLVSTVQDVTPELRTLGDMYVTARDLPGLTQATCFDNGTYRNFLLQDAMGMPIYVTAPYQSFRDVGAQYQSPQYMTAHPGSVTRSAECSMRLDSYRADVLPKIDAFVKSNIDAPIASLEAIPANWAGK